VEFLGDLELQAVFIESDNSEDALVATDMTGKSLGTITTPIWY